MVKGRGLPGPFLDKLRRIVPAPHWDKILRSFSLERPTTFRVNPLKKDVSSLKKVLEPLGFKVENVPWYKEAFLLRKGAQRDLEKTDLYEKGGIYVQGLSSMLPPLALQPLPGEEVLDLTAAPGGKATQLAALMENEGRVVANDRDPVRVEKLKTNAARQGAACLEVLPPGDGGLLWKGHFEAFDRVLLDAPCSSEGRFRTDLPSTCGYWREDTNRKCAKEQRRLFKSAFFCLKPGGTLVYSTCTFAPEENEGVLDWALQAYGDALELEEISIPLPLHTRGLAGWGGLRFHPSMGKAVRILPTADIEGFFLARLRKTGSLEPPEPFMPKT
jgi:tRNA (cytosine49-C5)-methyltransferase